MPLSLAHAHDAGRPADAAERASVHGSGINDAILDAIEAAAKDAGMRAPRPPRRLHGPRPPPKPRGGKADVPPLPLTPAEESLPPLVGASAASAAGPSVPSPPTSSHSAPSGSPRLQARRGSSGGMARMPSTVLERDEGGFADAASPPLPPRPAPARSPSPPPRALPPSRGQPASAQGPREFTPAYGSRLFSRGTEGGSVAHSRNEGAYGRAPWSAGAPPPASSRTVDPPSLWGFEPLRPPPSARSERVVYVTVPSPAAVPPGAAGSVVALGPPPPEAADSDAIYLSTLFGHFPPNARAHAHAHPPPDVGPSRVPPQYHVFEPVPLPLTVNGSPVRSVRESKQGTDARVFERLVFPTARPTDREEVLHLANALHRMLLSAAAAAPRRRSGAEGEGVPPNLEERFGMELRAWDVAFHEVIRQVRCHCWERGELLERIRARHAAIFSEAFGAVRTARAEIEAEEAAAQAASARAAGGGEAAAAAPAPANLSTRSAGSSLRRALAEVEEANERLAGELAVLRRENASLGTRISRAESENISLAHSLALARRRRAPPESPDRDAELEEAVRKRLLAEATGSARWDPEVVGRKAEEEELFRLYKDAYDKMEAMRDEAGAELQSMEARREAAIRFLLTWQNARQFRPQLSAYWALFFWTGLCRRRALLVGLLYEEKEAHNARPVLRFAMTQTDPWDTGDIEIPPTPPPDSTRQVENDSTQTDLVIVRPFVVREPKGIQCQLNPDGTEAERRDSPAGDGGGPAAPAEGGRDEPVPPPPPLETVPEEEVPPEPAKPAIKKVKNKKQQPRPPKPAAGAAPPPPPPPAAPVEDVPLKASERIAYNRAMAELEQLRAENRALRAAAAASARAALDAALGEVAAAARAALGEEEAQPEKKEMGEGEQEDEEEEEKEEKEPAEAPDGWYAVLERSLASIAEGEEGGTASSLDDAAAVAAAVGKVSDAIDRLRRRAEALELRERELRVENEGMRKSISEYEPRMRQVAQAAMRAKKGISSWDSLSSDPYRDPTIEFKGRGAGGKAWKPGGGAAWRRAAGFEPDSAFAGASQEGDSRPSTAAGSTGPRWATAAAPASSPSLASSVPWYLEGFSVGADAPANDLGLRFRQGNCWLAMVSVHPPEEGRGPLPPGYALRLLREFLRFRDVESAACSPRDPYHPLLFLPPDASRPDWSAPSPVPRLRDLAATFLMDKYGSRYLAGTHGYRLVSSMGLERSSSPWVEALSRVLEGAYSFDAFRCLYAGIVAMGRGAGAAGVGTALSSDGAFARPWLDPERARAVAAVALGGYSPGVVDWALSRATELYRETGGPSPESSAPRSLRGIPPPPASLPVAPRSFAGSVPPRSLVITEPGQMVAAPLLVLAISEAAVAVEHAFVRWVVHVFDEACGGRAAVTRNGLERLFRGGLGLGPGALAEGEEGWTPLVAQLWAAAAADGAGGGSLGLAAFGRAAAASPLMRAVFRAACAGVEPPEAAAAAACLSPLDAWRAVLRAREGGGPPAKTSPSPQSADEAAERLAAAEAEAPDAAAPAEPPEAAGATAAPPPGISVDAPDGEAAGG